MAEVTDILTLPEAKACVGLGSTTTYDTTLELLVTAISARLDSSDDGVGPVIVRDIGEQAFDGAGTFIQLSAWPVYSVSAVTEDGTALTVDQWRLDAATGQLHRRNGDYDYPWEIGVGNIGVTYRAGRFPSTATVPAFWKQGARLFLKHQWRAEQWNLGGIDVAEFDVPQIGFPSFSVPNAVKDWFGGDWRGSGRGGFV